MRHLCGLLGINLRTRAVRAIEREHLRLGVDLVGEGVPAQRELSDKSHEEGLIVSLRLGFGV